MNKLISISLIGLLLPFQVDGCAIPNQGEEYDKLIQLKKLSEKNVYHLSIPRSLYKSEGRPEIFLDYYTRELEEGCVEETFPDGMQRVCMPIDQYSEKVKLQSIIGDLIHLVLQNENYEGEFKISPKTGYLVDLTVVWPTPICFTYATKAIVK